MKVFITGDRSMNPAIALPLAQQLLEQIAMANAVASLSGSDERVEIVTGDNTGFEQAVRALLEGVGATPVVTPTGVDPETEKPAWDTRHEVVNAFADKVVFAHTDPLNSSIGKSLERVCGDKVEYALTSV